MSKQYFNKLDTVKLAELKEVELTKLQEVKLSIVGEAEKLIVDAKKNITEYRKRVAKAVKGEDKVQEILIKLSGTLDEVYDVGADLIDFQVQLTKKMKALEKSADDLGMNADDIPVYDELDNQYEEIKEVLNKSEDEIRVAAAYVSAL